MVKEVGPIIAGRNPDWLIIEFQHVHGNVYMWELHAQLWPYFSAAVSMLCDRWISVEKQDFCQHKA